MKTTTRGKRKRAQRRLQKLCRDGGRGKALQLAGRLGVTRGAISRYLSGERLPDGDVTEAILSMEA